jgi:hypothetical protein
VQQYTGLQVISVPVELARSILRRARPFQLIAWSRREHGRQLEIIRQVLAGLQERMDESSRHFAKIVRLHAAMQQIVAQQTGVNARLRDWNLERLWSQDAGYSIDALVEAVLGASEDEFVRAREDAIVQARRLPSSLTTGELLSRFQGARRRLPSQRARYTYEPPAEEPVETVAAAKLDPAAWLQQLLAERLAEHGARDNLPLELEAWLEGDRLAPDAWRVAVLSGLQGRNPAPRLNGTTRLQVLEPDAPAPAAMRDDALFATWEAAGLLRRLPPGSYSRLRLTTREEPT